MADVSAWLNRCGRVAWPVWMCGLTVNVAVRVPEEAAVGVAAGLMQGQARVFAERMQERHLWVFGERIR